LIANDELRDKITELFNGKVGSSCSPENLEKIYKKGKKRYELKIPPGFEDKGKDGVREYGDLVLWFQIIEHFNLEIGIFSNYVSNDPIFGCDRLVFHHNQI
jgi:hypothetical protein